MTLERVTRLTLVVSAAGAITLQTLLGARSWPPLALLNATLFAVALVTSRAAPDLARWLVLLPAYIFPAIFLRLIHGFDQAMWSTWTAALLGFVIGRTGWSGWALRPRWRLPLGLWGLAVAVSWPLIVWRELDFTFSQLGGHITSVTSIGISPAVECVWIAQVATTHLVGLLWVDTLSHDQAQEPAWRVDRQIGWPLLASIVLSAGLALYQMFGHIDVLNAGVFAGTRRASGAMLDGNAFGMAAALWIAGAATLSASTVSVTVRTLLGVAAGVLLVTVWGSGSASAFFVAAVAGLTVAYGLWHTRKTWGGKRTYWLLATVLLVGVAAVGGIGRLRSVATGPVVRVAQRARAATAQGRLGLLTMLWTRDRYGTAATAMIRQFPVTGVGVGMFNSFVIDETRLLGLGALVPDNAQNWFRHQLAEMGIVGSLGWLWWLAVFVPTLGKRPPATSPPVAVFTLRAGLIALGLASLIAMPTQNTAVLITFWVFVFWHGRLTGGSPETTRVTHRSRSWRWVAAVFVVLIYAAVVWRVGATELRVPERAAAVGWPYDHGFYDLEKGSSGQTYRWTGKRGVAVFLTPRRDSYVPLTFWAHHPDLREHPVHVRIWIRGHLDVDMMLADSRPVTRYIRVRADERAVMLETWVDRTWRPSDSGERDARSLGIALADWAFICCPPPGAIVLN